jgi:hypothetical protein
MSYVGGTSKDGLWGDMPKGEIDGFIPGEMMSLCAPNARSQMMIDTPLGKGDGVFFGLLFNFRRRGFDVHKVSEKMEISPVHSQYYQLTIGQKQALEGQIKTALAGVNTAISDYELLSHDYRRYKEYLDYFEAIEKAKKDKDEAKMKENERILRSIFIDQVDVHTGEGVALKMIVPRWPTIIVDFMKLNDEDNDPKKIGRDYEVSEVEGVVLSVKNKLYLKWREYFLETLKSRFRHLNELREARHRSIEEYRNMIRPYISRYKQIREIGETEGGRKMLFNQSWWRPSTQAVSMDASEYWLWKPFWPSEIHRPPMGAETEKRSIMRMPFDRVTRDYFKANWDMLKGVKKYETLTTSITGAEPIDKWVIFFMDKMVKYYHEKENFRATLDARDLLDARQDFFNKFKDMERWNWLLSPYFVTIELTLWRLVYRLPDGTESETLIVGDYPDNSMCAKMDSQNVMILRLLELKLQEKEFMHWVSDMIGETVAGRNIADILNEKHPSIFEKGKELKAGNFKVPDVAKQYGSFSSNIRFFRPGPYDSLFFERIAALSVKDIGQTVYAEMKKFLKSAAGAG